MVEGDGKGGVVVIGSKEDTYWTLSGVFITPFSRARRFKCFWLCLKARVHPSPPSLAPPFSPLSHYTPLTGYASFYLLPSYPVSHSFSFTPRFLRARPPCTPLRKPRKVHGTKGCNYHLGSSWPLPGEKRLRVATDNSYSILPLQDLSIWLSLHTFNWQFNLHSVYLSSMPWYVCIKKDISFFVTLINHYYLYICYYL